MPPKTKERVLLSKANFSNSPADPHMANKTITVEDPTAITLGVFFDTAQVQSCAPFWMCFKNSTSAGVALSSMCKIANVTNNNAKAKYDDDKWFIYCLTSQKGVEMYDWLETGDALSKSVGNGDIVYVGKGPDLPDGMEEQAPARVDKISGKKGSRAKEEVELTEEEKKALEEAKQREEEERRKEEEINRPVSPTKLAAARALLAAKRPAKPAPETPAPPPPAPAPQPSAPAKAPTLITIKCNFPELKNTIVKVTTSPYTPIRVFLEQLRQLQPKANTDPKAGGGLRIMFCGKYIADDKVLTDTINMIPLVDGSDLDVCTGMYYASLHEMTLYCAERCLKTVQTAIAAERKRKEKKDEAEMTNLRNYWHEQLMKAVMLYDSLQEVPEDIRQRRKEGVKKVMAEQDILAAFQF